MFECSVFEKPPEEGGFSYAQREHDLQVASKDGR